MVLALPNNPYRFNQALHSRGSEPCRNQLPSRHTGGASHYFSILGKSLFQVTDRERVARRTVTCDTSTPCLRCTSSAIGRRASPLSLSRSMVRMAACCYLTSSSSPTFLT